MPDLNVAALSAVIAKRLEEVGLDVQSTTTPGTDWLFAAVPTQHGDQTIAVHVVAQDGHIEPGRRAADDLVPAAPVMLAQRSIPARLAAIYRSRNQPYVDSGGNMWLRLPGSVLHIEGRKPSFDPAPSVKESARAFTPAGLRVVFVLLVSEPLRNATLRHIAAVAGVSLGATQAALSDLSNRGLLLESTSGHRIFRTAELTEWWVTGYQSRLRPKITEEALDGPEPLWWLGKISEVNDAGATLGGEVGLAALGYPLRPKGTLLYGDRPFGGAKKLGRLKTGTKCNVFLRQRFWKQDAWNEPHRTPSLLIYVDAMSSGDPRQREVAQELWSSDDDLQRLRNGR